MKRVTGIGGIFFKAKDAPALQAWYKTHLGIDVQAWGGAAFDCCSVRELRESPGYVWGVDRVAAKVDSATAIVRVRAVHADSAGHTVSFEPLEWIRGTPPSAALLVLPGSGRHSSRSDDADSAARLHYAPLGL